MSNGIWLCVMCHTVIDKEERNYSPDLLFHWRNSHEAKITAERGKPKELIRLREEERQMNDFADVSLFAQQIIRDKPPGWEYQLTAEALDNLFTPILRRWKGLHAGSYTKAVGQQKPDHYLRWVGAQIPELPKIAESLGDLINNRLKEAWGARGCQETQKEIVHVCRMITARATRLLEWDEAMHFVTPAKGFEIPKHLSKGVAVVMEKIPEISSFLRSIFHEGKAIPGTYTRTITFDLSDDFDTGLEDAMEAGRLAYEKRGRRWT
ncbi:MULTISPECIES: hypothetical protein [unclassified Mesorhizobium]|uniref:hypothetical protein n=1 Tax=unclassified Mesorhizobium TaxID=325217 RepID=UPI0003CEFF21|nr:MULTISPECIES: hypothetical protein [unclassified Mesorhizobium]ESX21390.1 hypothetical protein X767_19440 [Mesorhizobium sp. LSJC264A00]